MISIRLVGHVAPIPRTQFSSLSCLLQIHSRLSEWRGHPAGAKATLRRAAAQEEEEEEEGDGSPGTSEGQAQPAPALRRSLLLRPRGLRALLVDRLLLLLLLFAYLIKLAPGGFVPHKVYPINLSWPY